MANIFVSYAREDRARIEPFIDLLRQQDWSVWWDRELVPGHTFEVAIDEAIQEASCVVVFWSRNSVSSDWVLAEAHDGFERGILIPILLDDVRLPLVFRRKQSASLIEYPKQKDVSELKRILVAIGDILGRDPTHPEALIASRQIDVRRLGRNALTAFFVLFVTAAAILFFAGFITENTERADSKQVAEIGSGIPTISILPFKGTDDFITSLSFEVGDTLSEMGGLYVTPAEQIRAHVENGVPLDARYQVSGNVLHASDARSYPTLEIKLQDTKTQQIMWVEKIDIQQNNLAVSARQIAKRLASHLGIKVPLASVETTLPSEIYLKYLTAKASSRRPQSEQGLIETRELLLEVVKSSPRFAQARAILCNVYINMYKQTRTSENFEQAEKQCHRAITLNPNSSFAHTAMGQLYMTAGEFDLAQQHYDESLTITPYSTDAMRGVANNYEKQKRYSEAESMLLTTIAIEPNYWRNYQSLASIYFSTGDYEKAAQYFGSQAELVLQKAQALNNVGAAYFLLEAFDLAIDSWEQSIIEDPTAVTYTNIGSAYFFNHQYSRAITAYRSAVELNPDDHRMWGNLGEALFYSKGEFKNAFERAINLAEAELEINPSDVELLSRLSTYYSALGNDSISQQYLDKALLLPSDDVYTIYDFAVAHSRMGHVEKARTLIAKLVSMGYSESLINRDANFKNLEREENYL